MAESIGARVGRLISGSFNALVDAVENTAPEAVMEQAIREVDSAIDEVRAELGRTIASKHLASKRLLEANSRHETLTGQIDVAVESGRDDLAEVAIAQQMDMEAQIPVLEETIRDAGREEKELEGYVDALQARKRQMKEELRDYRRSRQEAEAAAAAAGGGGTSGSGAGGLPGRAAASKAEKATSAFERIMEKQTGLPGRIASMSDSGKLAELEELSRANRIKERLAQAKARGQS